MKKQLVLIAFVLVLTLLAGCAPVAPSSQSVTAEHTTEPVVVDSVDETSSDHTSEDLPDSPTRAPTVAPVAPTPTEVPADIPAADEQANDQPIPTPVGPVDPLAGLIYQASNALWRIEADGQAIQIAGFSGATVSPDGSQLLFERDDDLWLVDLDSGAESNLTNTPDRFESGGRWGPTGSHLIVFGSREATDIGPSTGHLSLMTTDGSDGRVLEPERSSNADPAFAPHGRTIAYDLGGSAWLYHVDSGSSEELDLAYYGLNNPEGIKIGSPAWSPDNQKIYFFTIDPSIQSSFYFFS